MELSSLGRYYLIVTWRHRLVLHRHYPASSCVTVFQAGQLMLDNLGSRFHN